MMKRLSTLLIGCAAVLVLCNASGCKNKSETPKTPAVAETPKTPEVAVEPAKTETTSPDLSKIEGSLVRIKTTLGDIIIKLYDETPQHRDNFLKLASEKFYDGLIFHRCIKNFMIQGGDPNSKGAAMTQMLGSGGPGYTIPAEFNPALIHKKGALCAARQGDQVNPKKASSGSQFYIVQGQTWTDMQLAQIEANIGYKMPGFKYTDEQKKIYQTVGGTAQLDMDYTVFGEVVSGLEIVDAIASEPTQRDRPLKDVTMNMEIIKKSK